MSISGCVYSWDNLTNSPKVLLYIREVFYAARELIDIVVCKVRNETSKKTAKDLESFVANYVNGTYNQYLELSPTLLKLDSSKNTMRAFMQIRQLRNKLKYSATDIYLSFSSDKSLVLKTEVDIPKWKDKIDNFDDLFNIKNRDIQRKSSSIVLEISVFNYILDILHLFGKLR
ncbi:MAG: hypothetical protein ACQERD_11315 [Campylobacterota bacterium]